MWDGKGERREKGGRGDGEEGCGEGEVKRVGKEDCRHLVGFLIRVLSDPNIAAIEGASKKNLKRLRIVLEGFLHEFFLFLLHFLFYF